MGTGGTLDAPNDALDALFAAATRDDRRFDPAAELARRQVLALVAGNPSKASLQLGRFEVVRCVGRGGMGSVFEAHDGKTGGVVALKVLNDAPDEALARLKREFRALRDIGHPNLVTMYELHVERDLPFFTMELIDGPSLSQMLARGAAFGTRTIAGCLLQLGEALDAIHRRGTVHGDVKPSNILIQRGRRLTLVDFGVARVLGEPRHVGASGTPAYRSPERARGEPLTSTGDWYAVGAVLRELLEHVRKPRSGSDAERLAALQALCTGLLRPEPQERFGLKEIDDALGATDPRRAAPESEPDAAFVGREAELADLHAALHRVSEGPVVCAVSGEAGMGKTALVERFLASPALGIALVLRGRCYDDETMPYKGVEGVIEGLASFLQGLPDADRTALAPAEAHALLQVFPPLRRAGLRASREAHPYLEPRLVRQRAFAQLAELLGAVARQRTLVLFIDDLQWGDADGGALLQDLLSTPRAPAMLFIASFRSGEDGRCLTAFNAAATPAIPIALGPLRAGDCERLACEKLRRPVDPDVRDGLMRESGGSPLLLHALLESSGSPGKRPRSYSELLVEHVGALDATARDLLRLVVLAGCPVSLGLLREAAGIAPQPHGCLSLLRRRRLVRALAREDGAHWVPHHDRVREVLTGMLPQEVRRNYHARLARAAIAIGLEDPEFLYDQYARAHELAAAAPYAERAGDRARQTMALGRARDLYARALECHAPARPLGLVEKLAEAAAAAGDLKSAAPLYLEAAAGAGKDGWQHRLRAAEVYLQRGDAAEGMQLLRPAMRAARIPVPSSMLRAIAMGLLGLARSRLAARPAIITDAPEDLQAELSFRAGYLMTLHDAKGAALVLWSAARALRHGSNAQRGRALATLSHVYSVLGLGTKDGQDALLNQSLALTRSDPMAHAVALLSRALIGFGRCECDDALAAIDTAIALFVDRQLDAQWMLGQIHTLVAAVCVLAGDFQRIRRFAPVAEREAYEVGNRTVLAQIQSSLGWASLAAGDPEAMRRYTRATMEEWAAPRLSPLYGIAVWCECHRLMYVGEAEGAHALMQREAPRFVRAGLSRTQMWRVALEQMWGTVELSCSRAVGDTNFRAAERHARTLERQPLLWPRACAALLRAGLARRAHRYEAAQQGYREARQGFTRLGMRGFAAVAGHRELQLVGVPAGDVHLTWFASQSVADASRWVCMYAP